MQFKFSAIGLYVVALYLAGAQKCRAAGGPSVPRFFTGEEVMNGNKTIVFVKGLVRSKGPNRWNGPDMGCLSSGGRILPGSKMQVATPVECGKDPEIWEASFTEVGMRLQSLSVSSTCFTLLNGMYSWACIFRGPDPGKGGYLKSAGSAGSYYMTTSPGLLSDNDAEMHMYLEKQRHVYWPLVTSEDSWMTVNKKKELNLYRSSDYWAAFRFHKVVSYFAIL